MRNYTVYIHQNQVNGKRYVGITADTVESRWRNGAGYRNQVFGRAIEKYGWENFSHIIVADNLSKEQAEELEIALIKQFDTQNPQYGYNITSGGGAILPELYKTVYQFNSKGELIATYTSYKEAEKNTGVRADSIGLVCSGKQYTAGGFVWSNTEMSKEAIIQRFIESSKARSLGAQKGINKAIKKISMKVQQIDPKTGLVVAEYPSQREAARTVGIDQKGISSVIRGKQKTSGGFIWKQI